MLGLRSFSELNVGSTSFLIALFRHSLQGLEMFSLFEGCGLGLCKLRVWFFAPLSQSLSQLYYDDKSGDSELNGKVRGVPQGSESKV